MRGRFFRWSSEERRQFGEGVRQIAEEVRAGEGAVVFVLEALAVHCCLRTGRTCRGAGNRGCFMLGLCLVCKVRGQMFLWRSGRVCLTLGRCCTLR